MSAELQNIQAHLNESNKNFIDVLNLETERFLEKKFSLEKIDLKAATYQHASLWWNCVTVVSKNILYSGHPFSRHSDAKYLF